MSNTLRRTYFRDLLTNENRLTMPEVLPTHERENVAAVCRQQFYMSPADADRAASFAVNVPDLTVSDLNTLDAMLRREN